MPSPFPGMDPWLEGKYWSVVQHDLCSQIAHQLGSRLAPKYFASPNERRVCKSETDTDIHMLSAISALAFRPTRNEVDESTIAKPGASVVTTMTPSSLTTETFVQTTLPHFFVEIYDTKGGKLVTIIEVLGHANKTSPGYEQYVTKRSQVLRSRVHLLEIDLLRLGRRIPTHKPLPADPYFVYLNRAGEKPRTRTEVWSIAITSQLPTVPVPLLRRDPDVPLNLQAAFSKVYDLNAFQISVRYCDPAEVPMSEQEETWANDRLRAAGRRKSKA